VHDDLLLIAGPCAVESREQLERAALDVAAGGADMLRGGAFKPRTSPRAFQGLGHEGLRLLAEVRAATGLPVVTELLDPRDAEAVAEVADVVQLGTRSMGNVPLLREAGRTGRPVLLKRGMAATIDEWLAAADHVLATGNEQVLLCERGIRTFETAYRATLDLGAIPVLKERTQLPVIVDPSHAAGQRRWVEPLALAAVAAGADGIIVEVHPDPDRALSDAAQQLDSADFAGFASRVRAVRRPLVA
jgi:3-deoxy-7-phosphoheptulonate synthase